MSHRGHGQVGPQVEEGDADNQQQGGDAEYRHFTPGQGHERGQRKDENDQADRKDGSQGFLQFLEQFLSHSMQITQKYGFLR